MLAKTTLDELRANSTELTEFELDLTELSALDLKRLTIALEKNDKLLHLYLTGTIGAKQFGALLQLMHVVQPERLFILKLNIRACSLNSVELQTIINLAKGIDMTQLLTLSNCSIDDNSKMLILWQLAFKQSLIIKLHEEEPSDFGILVTELSQLENTGVVDNLKLIEAALAEIKACKEIFWELLDASKDDDNLATAAAYAATILNLVDEPFADKDLSGVQIPGAYLIGADLSNTNFSEADLRYVCFAGSRYEINDFDEAKLLGASWDLATLALNDPQRFKLIKSLINLQLKLHNLQSHQWYHSTNFYGKGKPFPDVAEATVLPGNKLAIVESLDKENSRYDSNGIPYNILDKQITIWDLTQGNIIHRLKLNHQFENTPARCKNLIALPNDCLAYHDDWTIYIHTVTGDRVRCIFPNRSNGDNSIRVGGTITSLFCLANGQLACALSFGRIEIFNLVTGESVRRWDVDSKYETLSQFTDNQLLCAAADRFDIWNIDTAQLEERRPVNYLSNKIKSIGFEPSVGWLFGTDDNIKIYERVFNNCGEFYHFLDLSWDKYIALSEDLLAGSRDNQVMLFYIKSKRMLSLGTHATEINKLSRLSDTELISVSRDGIIKHWNVEQKKKCVRTLGRNHSLKKFALLSDGQLISGSSTGEINIWHKWIPSGIRKILDIHSLYNIEHSLNLPYGDFALAEDGKLVIAYHTAANLFKLILLDISEQKNLCEIEIRERYNNIYPRNLSNYPNKLITFPKGFVAFLSISSIKLYHLTTGRLVAELSEQGTYFTCIAPFGYEKLISGTEDGKLMVWSLSSTQPLLTIEAHKGSIISLVKQKHSGIISYGSDNLIKVWDSTGKLISQLNCQDVGVTYIMPLSNHLILAGCDTGGIKIWDITRQTCLKELSAHQEAITFLGITPDGSLLSCTANEIRRWANGEDLTFELLRQLDEITIKRMPAKQKDKLQTKQTKTTVSTFQRSALNNSNKTEKPASATLYSNVPKAERENSGAIRGKPPYIGMRVDLLNPNGLAQRKDIIEVQAKYPDAIFILPDNYPDCELPANQLHMSQHRGGLANPMRPNKVGGNDVAPEYDVVVIGIPALSYDASHPLTVADIKNSFKKLYQQVQFNRTLIVPYTIQDGEIVPAFGGGVVKNMPADIKQAIREGFRQLEAYCNDTTLLTTLDADYQQAIQEAKANPEQYQWPVAKASKKVESVRPSKTGFFSHQSNITSRFIQRRRDDLQLGWNCFDVAVGITRNDLVTYALTNANNLEFRRYLAIEMKHAAAAQGQFALPRGMETAELIALRDAYINAANHPEFMQALNACNDLLDFNEGNRKNVDELKSLFSAENYQRQHLEAYTIYQNAIQHYYTPHEDAFNEYLQRETTYHQYIKDYYGARNWVAFQRNLEGEESGSMVDITARCINKQIIIYHQNEQGDYSIAYQTAARPEYKGEQVEILHAYGNHFIHLERNEPQSALRP